MSTLVSPVSDLLLTVKSREIQRAMFAEMRNDRPAAIRHFLAAAHLELVVAADYDSAGQMDLAWRSRLSAASCFGRAGESEPARRLLEDLLRRHPDREDEIRQTLAKLFPNNAGPTA